MLCDPNPVHDTRRAIPLWQYGESMPYFVPILAAPTKPVIPVLKPYLGSMKK